MSTRVSLLPMLFSSGFPVFLIGLAVIAVGCYVLVRPSLSGCVLLLCLIPLPAGLALFRIFQATTQLAAMAQASTAPKPAAMAGQIQSAIGSSVMGLGSVMLISLLAAVVTLRVMGAERSNAC